GVHGEVPGDRATVTFTITGTFTYTNNTKVAIPDLGKGTTSISVGQNFTVGAVRVQLNITHTFDHDLFIHLVGPDGTDVTLGLRRGDAGHNFTNTLFDDNATTPIANGSAPFTGTYKPEQPLSAFAGKSAKGTWQLWAEDQQACDSGTLNSWTLFLDPAT